MSFVVTIVRHAQTDYNVKHLVHTYSDGSINETGQKQAQELGAHLANQIFTKAFSSDMKRTQDTAKGVFKCSNHQVPDVVLDKRLRERTFGEYFEGRANKEIFELALQSGQQPLRYTPPGGEPYEVALERSGSFFRELCETRENITEDENVVVFTHGLWIMFLFQYLNSKPDEYILENFDYKKHLYLAPPNTGITKLIIHESQNGKRRLEFIHIHDDSHLTEFTLRPIFNLTTRAT